MMFIFQISVAIVTLCSVFGAICLALSGVRYILNNMAQNENLTDLPNFSIIIPTLGSEKRLTTCLDALIRNLPPSAKKIIISLQNFSDSTENDIKANWCGCIDLKVCKLYGPPNKSSAIALALQFVETEWILMLDADTQPSPYLYKLFDSLGNTDAAYGMILPTMQQNRTFLGHVVKADKVLSHGVWRLGRFATGLWPNLPGQCYAIRSSLLFSIYDNMMGHLDDMSVTLKLAASRSRVKFIPSVVCYEESRSTWCGLFSQRSRWAIGLIQSANKLFWISGAWFHAFACWLIHAWFYFGWPIFTGVSIFTFFVLDRPFWAFSTAISFSLSWSLLVLVGSRVFGYIYPDFIPVKFTTEAFPASFFIMLAQILGLMMAPGFLLVQAINFSLGNHILYKR